MVEMGKVVRAGSLDILNIWAPLQSTALSRAQLETSAQANLLLIELLQRIIFINEAI